MDGHGDVQKNRGDQPFRRDRRFENVLAPDKKKVRLNKECEKVSPV